MWRNFVIAQLKITLISFNLVFPSFWFLYEVKATSVGWIKIMLTWAQFFLRQQCKNILLKVSLTFLPEVFQFKIAKKCYNQKSYPFVTMWLSALLMLSRKC